AEAQHIAPEFVCQFEKKRRAIPAIALTTDSSILTAQSNDFGFDSVFSRQIEALCQRGDVVIGLTTSDVYEDGHSRNIFNAFEMAKMKGAKTIGLFSIKTKNLVKLVDVAILVPAESTALIQEVHLAIIHMLCGQIEKSL
ncbi:MAG: SIS domain-containing protein, partial [Patescibacteria group bacterium]